MEKKGPVIFSLTLFCLTPFLLSQEQKEHHEIVVTATRLEVPAREVASSVAVFSLEDLERMKRMSLLEILRNVVGVSVSQNGGQGEAASVFLRGANSEHTLVLLDGVPLNDPINPSRSADLAHLYLQNIERIEILRGPQSPLFGSDALGGVISVITRQGQGRPGLTLSSSAGSLGTYTGQVGLTGSNRAVHYSFGLSRFETKGVSAADALLPGNSEVDGYRNLTLSGRVGLAFKGNLEASLTGRWIGAKTDIDNFGGPYGDDPNSVQDYRSSFLKGEVRGLFLKNRWEQKLGVGIFYSRRSNNNPPDEIHPSESETGLFRGRLVKVDWQNNVFLLPSNTLTMGLEYELEEGASEYLATGLWGSSASTFSWKRAAMAGLYVQDFVGHADRFFATIGMRFDHHSRAGEAVTFRLAPAYILNADGTKLRASLGTAFKAPSLYQLYAPGTFFGPIGNENLKPERSFGWDAGIEQPLFGGSARLSVTYFQNDFRNLINFDYVLGYTNIGRAESKGLEIEAEGRWNGVLFLRASYTHLQTRDALTGAALLRRPRDMFGASLSLLFSEKLRLTASYDFVGQREDLDSWSWPSRSVILPPYSLLNGVISYALNPHVRVFGRLDNILNARYEMVYGYGTLGFSLQTGVEISL
jgi:vitamin B12 transporter